MTREYTVIYEYTKVNECVWEYGSMTVVAYDAKDAKVQAEIQKQGYRGFNVLSVSPK